MSIVKRTVEAFPRGRTTEELVVLLDAAFDDAKRRAIVAELQVLAQSGVIRLERNGRWKPAAPPRPIENKTASGATASSVGTEADVLFAVLGRITQERLAEESATSDDEQGVQGSEFLLALSGFHDCTNLSSYTYAPHFVYQYVDLVDKKGSQTISFDNLPSIVADDLEYAASLLRDPTYIAAFDAFSA